MADFTSKTAADGVAIITWDVADKSMNVMRADALQEGAAIHHIATPCCHEVAKTVARCRFPNTHSSPAHIEIVQRSIA